MYSALVPDSCRPPSQASHPCKQALLCVHGRLQQHGYLGNGDGQVVAEHGLVKGMDGMQCLVPGFNTPEGRP